MQSQSADLTVFYAGHKLSLIDVSGEPALVLWFCGCNLRCPYCHNWRIAEGDRGLCSETPVDYVKQVLEQYRPLADWVLFTGGEPTLQPVQVVDIAVYAKGLGYRLALETNMSRPELLALILSKVKFDMVIFDVKVPPEVFTGLPPGDAERYLRNLARSVGLLRQLGVPVVEVRRLKAPRCSSSESFIDMVTRVLGGRCRVIVRDIVLKRELARDKNWMGWG